LPEEVFEKKPVGKFSPKPDRLCVKGTIIPKLWNDVLQDPTVQHQILSLKRKFQNPFHTSNVDLLIGTSKRGLKSQDIRFGLKVLQLIGVQLYKMKKPDIRF
jgi:hypothetical protein